MGVFPKIQLESLLFLYSERAGPFNVTQKNPVPCPSIRGLCIIWPGTLSDTPGRLGHSETGGDTPCDTSVFSDTLGDTSWDTSGPKSPRETPAACQCVCNALAIPAGGGTNVPYPQTGSLFFCFSLEESLSFLSFSLSLSLTFSFVLFELQHLVLKGKVLGGNV